MAESNKNRILEHNARLETAVSGLSVLPTYEDIDAEVTEQEDIIAEIMAVLPFKGAADSITPEMFGCTEIATDTLIYSSNQTIGTKMDINHSLGAIPKVFLIIADGELDDGSSTYYLCMMLGLVRPDSGPYPAMCSLRYQGSAGIYNRDAASLSNYATINTLPIQAASSYFKAGTEYTLITMA